MSNEVEVDVVVAESEVEAAELKGYDDGYTDGYQDGLAKASEMARACKNPVGYNLAEEIDNEIRRHQS